MQKFVYRKEKRVNKTKTKSIEIRTSDTFNFNGFSIQQESPTDGKNGRRGISMEKEAGRECQSLFFTKKSSNILRHYSNENTLTSCRFSIRYLTYLRYNAKSLNYRTRFPYRLFIRAQL